MSRYLSLMQPTLFLTVKIQREDADTSVRYMKVAVAASGMSERLEG